MRTGFIAAALAATALAVPHDKKRAVVTATDVDVVYVTDIVTVTQGGAPAEYTEVEPTTLNHWGHHKPHWGGGWGTKKQKPTTVATTEATTPATTEETTPATTPATTWEQTTPATTPTTVKTTHKTQPTQPANTSPAEAPTDYASKATLHHNLHRRNHSATDIKWSDSLAKSAADIAATCLYEHNTEMDGGGYGQNIAAGVEADNITAIITDLFYNAEVGYYNGLYGQASPDMSNFEKWGHFSQIVWKGTTHFGCATQDCSSQGLGNVGGDVSPYFTVCNYKSPGNFANEYGDNVGEPLGDATAEWNTGL